MFNILIFKSAILRSDAQHIKTSSGLLLFLLIALITYFTFRSVIIFFKKRKINKKLISFFKKNHRYILVTILFFNFFIVSDYSINPKIYCVNIACVEGIKPFEIKNVPVSAGENHPLDQKK